METSGRSGEEKLWDLQYRMKDSSPWNYEMFQNCIKSLLLVNGPKLSYPLSPAYATEAIQSHGQREEKKLAVWNSEN